MYLTRIEIIDFRLEGKDIIWDLHPDVNILVGLNGCGKTTVLNLIDEALDHNGYPGYEKYSLSMFREKDKKCKEIRLIFSEKNTIRHSKISTFDIPLNDFREELIYDKDNRHTLLDIALHKATSDFRIFQSNLRSELDEMYFAENKYSKEEKEKIEEQLKIQSERRKRLVEIINQLFTDKVLNIKYDFVFQKESGQVIEIAKLSAGEKQMLLILLSVFMQNQQPHILLLDEPEISMHIYWQRELLRNIRTINPHCQIIVATHAASVFGRGWMDNMVRWEEIIQPAKMT